MILSIRTLSCRAVRRAALLGPLLGLAFLLPSHSAVGQAIDAGTNRVASPDAPAIVAVRLKSGRTFVGHVDARTDAATLWLRIEDGRTTLWRPIAWQRVEQAVVGTDQRTPQQLRDDAPRLASPFDATRNAWPSAPPEPVSDRVAERSGASSARVRALSIDVRFANWDADAEDDGFVAAIAPLDETGRPLATTGTLTVELVGMTGPRTPNWAGIPIAPESQRPTLETWTVQLSTDRFLDGVAHVRLPFTGGDPADDPRLGSFGVVRARLAVPGSDVVEAELDPVRLRPLGKIGNPGR